MIAERPPQPAAGRALRGLPRATELLCLVAVLAALGLGGERLRLMLRYDRAALAQGEWWRAFSGHLVHLGWAHWALNVAGLIGLWWLYVEQASTRQWLALSLFCAAFISAALYLTAPEVGWYVGLSGLLHGLWAAAGVALWRESRLESVAALGLLAAKLALEVRYGALSAGPGDALVVVTGAHRAGALGGLAGALGLGWWRKSL